MQENNKEATTMLFCIGVASSSIVKLQTVRKFVRK